MSIIDITKDKLIVVINTTKSMREAAKVLGIDYKTLKKYAKLYDVWRTNQSGKGIPTKDWSTVPFDSLTNRRKRKRILDDAHNSCELCGFNRARRDGRSVIQVDHIDGNHNNWSRSNLRALCPNCHAVDSEHFMFYGRKHSTESKLKCGQRGYVNV